MKNVIKEMENVIKELKPYRKLLEELAPCGETPEVAWKDSTPYQINGPRAVLMAQFQAQVSLLYRLHKEGKLKK